MRTSLIVWSTLLSSHALLGACGSSAESPAADDTTTLSDGVSTAIHDASALDPSGAGPMDDAGAGALDAATGAANEVDAAVFADSCSVTAPTSCPTPAPTYATVAPIFKERCVVCHAPSWGGPWPLDSYRHIADWKDDIRAHLLLCTMPPPEARIPMTRDERMTILTWIRCNLPM